MSSGVCNNATERRFELDVEGHLAVACYTLSDGVMTFTHTEVLPELSGRGVASRLIGGALDEVRALGLRVVAKCPFVAGYLGKHPEFNDLVL